MTGTVKLSIAEADNVTLVNCSGRGVKDLTGLEACTNLETIDCSNNEISTIRLPRLTKLTTLRCYGNPVEVLDLTGCAALQALYLQDVNTNAVRTENTVWIEYYDQSPVFVFSVADTRFSELAIQTSPNLTSVDVSANTQLERLYCNANSSLQNIDVSALTALKYLDVSACDLRTLNVTHNIDLETMFCNDNSLLSLNVAENTKLLKLYCNTNNLSELNVTSNAKLQHLEVQGNSLSAINLRNNPDLAYLDISENSAVNVLNVSNNPVLTELRASGLSISDINLSANTALTYLDLSENAGIAQLDLSANTALTYMDFRGMQSLVQLSCFTGQVPINVITFMLNNDILHFIDNTNDYFVSCERSENMSWDSADTYWKDKGLRLPNSDEAKVIYANKAELDAALMLAGYSDSYFHSTDDYWTSNSHYINMEDGSISSVNNYNIYSFGIYVK